MTEAPKISVVVPTYNRVELLASSLASLETQSLPTAEFEVIVVDDGSTDGTPDLCRGWDGPLQLRYLRQANSGSAAAKNLGIFASDAPLVFFFDDDDVAGARLLEEHLEAHSRYPDEWVAILNFTTWDRSLDVTPVMDYLVNVGQHLFSYPSLDPEHELGWQHFWTGRISCKRRFLTHHGIFSPRMSRLEDVELGFRLARSGLVVRYWPKAISYMLRPISFTDFCARAEGDGRARTVFRRLHSSPDLDEYCHSNARERWTELSADLDAVIRAVGVLEELVETPPVSNATATVAALYELYNRAFTAYSVKGATEGDVFSPVSDSTDTVRDAVEMNGGEGDFRGLS